MLIKWNSPLDSVTYKCYITYHNIELLVSVVAAKTSLEV